MAEWQPHQYDELKLLLAPETELAAVQPLVEGVSDDFFKITIEKQTFGVAAGGLEVALIVVIAVGAFEFVRSFVSGFASEAGRDTYSYLKQAIVRTYRMLPVQTERCTFLPMGFELHLENPHRIVTYSLPGQMVSHQILRALEMMVGDVVTRKDGDWLVYDSDSEQWNVEDPHL